MVATLYGASMGSKEGKNVIPVAVRYSIPVEPIALIAFECVHNRILPWGRTGILRMERPTLLGSVLVRSALIAIKVAIGGAR
jgi:hypothetical protein